MSTFTSILAILAAIAILFILFRSIKGNPQMFSAENFSKSFGTMGVLGLILIGFIALLVLMLRQS